MPAFSPTGHGSAIALMVSAIFCFSVMDATVKGVAPLVGVLPALWARYAGQMVLVTVLVAPRLRSVTRTRYPVLQFLRSLLLLMATACFFTALSHIGLAEAAAVMSTNPVLITLGAALFLGERLGPRRIAGIAVAMVGAFIVIRPGSDVFSPYAFFALGAALSYSCYALLTRKVGSDEDVWTSLFYTGLVGTILLTLIVPFVWVTPDGTGVMLMIGAALFGTCGQLLLIRALSAGEASMLAPFAYSGLIFAAVLGMVFFAEFPDFWTVLGALVIAGAGIYVWRRETRTRAETHPAG